MAKKTKKDTDEVNQDKRTVFWKELAKGLVISNPVFILALGLCPALAVTNSIDNALGMGAGVIFVLLCSNIIISTIKKAIPSLVRIPVFMVITATFVTILSLVFEAYIPPLHESLGIYLPLMAVNCIILGRAEVFASRRNVGRSIADAVGIGLGFTIALVIIALFREILGTGALSVFGFNLFSIPVLSEHPMMFFTSPPGAFLVMGLLMALFRWIGVFKND
jgi:electron transport complex protein RnfE